MDLNELSIQCLKNAEIREKNGAKLSTETRNMLKHTATEVVETVEAYSLWNLNKNNSLENKKNFASEIADIVCCCMIISAKEKIDLENEIYKCIEKNKRRALCIGDKL